MKAILYLLVSAALAAFAAAFAAPAVAADIAVLLQPAARGAVIAEADLGSAEVPETIAAGALRADEIAGKAATRNLAAGRPLRRHDVRTPLVVARGAPVTLTFARGRLEITAPGKAMQGGGVGDEVRVQTMGSRKLLTGTVTDSGRVAVTGAR